jgi:cell division septation protein DedD
MQKIITILMGLTFCHSAAANYKDDILELCSVARQGNFSQIQAKGQIQGDGSIKLATLGGKGELSFSKGEWNGVQQVLKDHQATDNVSARDCVLKLMPYFKSKIATPHVPQKSASKSTVKANTAKAKPVATPTPKTAPIAESDGDTNALNIGSQSAEKIINATEINGNIDMGN